MRNTRSVSRRASATRRVWGWVGLTATTITTCGDRMYADWKESLSADDVVNCVSYSD